MENKRSVLPDPLRFPGLKKLEIQGETKLIGLEKKIFHDAVRSICSLAKVKDKIQS